MSPPRSRRPPPMLKLMELPPAKFPPKAALARLIHQLDQLPQPGTPRPPVLSALSVEKHPQRLGPCHEVNLAQTTAAAECTFVLSQRRREGSGYITVAGEHGGAAAGTDGWPRLPSRRKKLLALHRWILEATRVPPPDSQYEASHICGNSRCVLAAHLRWQLRHTNRVLDRRFHAAKHLGPQRYSRLSWSVTDAWQVA